jgi:adenylosuccinate synthase
MPVTVLVGCQWGDEGKGRVADYLSRGMDWVARYGGGHNAGHTVRVGGRTFVLHLIPCGILQPRPKCLLGHGTVIDPVALLEEIHILAAAGVSVAGRLFVSEMSHLVLPYHRWLESLEGQDSRIGTTGRGIGPAYQDKAGRYGIRFIDLLDPLRFKRRLEDQASRLRERFAARGVEIPVPLDRALPEWIETYGEVAAQLRPYAADTVDLLQEAHRRGERILCEGAQGALLDLDLGTYPYVTSSTTTAGGAITGLGLPPTAIRRVIGVSKAYATRVGQGPFPTELSGVEADRLREAGGEYGATTGRPRRVGWCDLPLLRKAVRLNGVTSLILTKLDVLSGWDRLRLCVSYEAGERGLHPAHDADRLTACRPVYEDLPGWGVWKGRPRGFAGLPSEAQSYVRRLEAGAGCPIQMVSIGPARPDAVRVPAGAR